MTGEGFLHHLVEDGSGLDERLVHCNQISPLLTVLVDEFDDLRPECHTGPIQFLNLLVVGKVVMRGVYFLEHTQ